MTLDPVKVQEFTRRFHEKYDEESNLNHISNLIPYSKEYNDLDYYKIGRRVGLPTSVIDDEADPVMIISSFVRALTTGERNFILRQLIEDADHGNIETIPIEEVSNNAIQSWFKHVDEPDTLFLPLDKEYFSESNLLTLEPELDITLNWVPLKHGIKHGFLFNSSEIHVVQKWFNEMEAPSFDHASQFDKYSMNRPVGLFFGTETFLDTEQEPRFQTQIDFLYQTLLSEILVTDQAAVRLEPQKQLLE